MPGGVEDLDGDGPVPLHRDWLVIAGQAMIWQAPFTSGRLTAVPMDGASAVLVRTESGAGLNRWHDRFARGPAHRMAGEPAIASVTAGLLGEAGRAECGEEAGLLDSALEGLTRLPADPSDARMSMETADRIVADTVCTHKALIGGIIHQSVTVTERPGFTVHTVRSVTDEMSTAELERIRERIGLPWSIWHRGRPTTNWGRCVRRRRSAVHRRNAHPPGFTSCGRVLERLGRGDRHAVEGGASGAAGRW